jgi:hypothetical protein
MQALKLAYNLFGVPAQKEPKRLPLILIVQIIQKFQPSLVLKKKLFYNASNIVGSLSTA